MLFILENAIKLQGLLICNMSNFDVGLLLSFNERLIVFKVFICIGVFNKMYIVQLFF